MKYAYKARTKEGKIETGNIEAHSEEAAVSLLQKYNIFVTSIKEDKLKKLFLEIRFQKKISKKDLVIFFRQLAVMLESRVPIVQSLSSLADQAHKPNFKEVILKISGMVEEGVSLSKAMTAYPKIFGNFYINLVKSGEESGSISRALYYISDQLERENDIISQVRNAMVYPALVIFVFFVTIVIIAVGVMPRIADLVRESGSEQSLSTLRVLNFYRFLGAYWWILAIVFFLFIVSMVYYFKTKEGKKYYDKISLKIPLVGDILKKVFLARFCSNISTLLIAGISISKALKITEDTVNNTTYKRIIAEIGEGVSSGERMSSIMINHKDYFPSFVVKMIKVGEETGKLDKTLIEVVNFYQKEIKKSIDLFSTLVEPIMIILLGVIVAMLAISVFSSIYGVIGSFG